MKDMELLNLEAMSRKELMAQLAAVDYQGPHSYTLRVLREILAKETGKTELPQLTGNRKAREIFGRPGVTGPRGGKALDLAQFDVVTIRAKDDKKGTWHAHSVDCKTCNNSTMYLKAEREQALANPTRVTSRDDVLRDLYSDVASDHGEPGTPEFEEALAENAGEIFFHTCLKELA